MRVLYADVHDFSEGFDLSVGLGSICLNVVPDHEQLPSIQGESRRDLNESGLTWQV